MVDATLIEPVLPASPGKPAAFRKLLRNPSVMFGATKTFTEEKTVGKARRFVDVGARALARVLRPAASQSLTIHHSHTNIAES